MLACGFAGHGFVSTDADAGAIRDDSTYAAYDAALLNGVVAETVGRVTYGFTGSASGIYLGDGWVLTAAHVGDDDLDFDFTLNGTAYASADVFVHPDWDRADITAGNDLALIQLGQAIPGVDGAPLYAGTAAQLLGNTATLAGYGNTGTGDTGGTGPDGDLHAGQNRVDRRGGQSPFASYNSGIVFVDFDDPDQNNDGYSWSPDPALTYEFLIASGDSGGPLFVERGDELQVAGVASFLLANDGTIDGDYGDIGGFFTLDGMLPWIAETTGTAVLLTGDANQNGTIEQGDLDAVLQNWGRSNRTWAQGDLDGNGSVEQGDLDLVLQNWGSVTAPDFGTPIVGNNIVLPGGSSAVVPEPTTLAAALLAPLTLRRRRHND